MGPPPRSLAAEANGCFMVRPPRGANRIQGRGAILCAPRRAPLGSFASRTSSHHDQSATCLTAIPIPTANQDTRDEIPLTAKGPIQAVTYADSGYQGPKFRDGLAAACARVNVEIVKRSDLNRFVVLPKRWIVERTIAWLNRCRRLAKDWECLNRTGLAFLRWASAP